MPCRLCLTVVSGRGMSAPAPDPDTAGLIAHFDLGLAVKGRKAPDHRGHDQPVTAIRRLDCRQLIRTRECRCQIVEERHFFMRQCVDGHPISEAPIVPRKYLDLVESGEIPQEAAADEPETLDSDARDAKAIGIRLATTGKSPRIRGDEKFVAAQVELVRCNTDLRLDDWIDVGIDEQPAPLAFIPVLADAVVAI